MMNTVGTFVFDSIKPFVLAEANTNMRNDLNKEIQKIPKTFPNSISPFDEVICEVRRKVRSMGFDPYKVPDYNNTAAIFDVYLTNTWLFGLSSFHRTNDIIFEMKNKTVHAFLEIGTAKLKGQSNWEIAFVSGILGKAGTVDFTVDYFKVCRGCIILFKPYLFIYYIRLLSSCSVKFFRGLCISRTFHIV